MWRISPTLVTGGCQHGAVSMLHNQGRCEAQQQDSWMLSDGFKPIGIGSQCPFRVRYMWRKKYIYSIVLSTCNGGEMRRALEGEPQQQPPLQAAVLVRRNGFYKNT